jgi:threonine synthase
MEGILRRYAADLPINANTPFITLGEGGTPLLRLGRLGEELGVELYAKVEGCNPTGSFKDRGMVLAVAKAMEAGAKGVICASTGNTSASAAAYAARAGLACTVLLPEGKVALGKLSQALILGARALAVRGNFDRALELARMVSKESGLALVNSINPYRLMGQRSGAFEIVEALGDGPDWLAIPVGNAGNITAYWAGFTNRVVKGKARHVPRMLGVQAEGAAPMVLGHPVDRPETVATAIRIGHPANERKARFVVSSAGGEFIAVSDGEILSAQGLLARSEGVFAEPASCAPLAGLLKLKGEGRLPGGIRVVMILTGNGLKDPEAALRETRIESVDPEIEALREALAQ